MKISLTLIDWPILNYLIIKIVDVNYVENCEDAL